MVKSEFITSLENVLMSLVPFWANKILSSITLGNEYSMLITMLLTQSMKFAMSQKEEHALCFIVVLLFIVIILQSGCLNLKEFSWYTFSEISEEFWLDVPEYSDRYCQLNNSLLELNDLSRNPVIKQKYMKWQLQPTPKFVHIQDKIYVNIQKNSKDKTVDNKTIKSNFVLFTFRNYGSKEVPLLENFLNEWLEKRPLKKKFQWNLVKCDSVEGVTPMIKAFHYFAIHKMNLTSITFLNEINIHKKYKDYDYTDANTANTNNAKSEMIGPRPKKVWKHAPKEDKDQEEEEEEEKIENFIFPELTDFVLPSPYQDISFSIIQKSEKQQVYQLEANDKTVISDFLETIQEEYDQHFSKKYIYITNSFEERTPNLTIGLNNYSGMSFAINYYLVSKLGIQASTFRLDNSYNSQTLNIINSKSVLFRITCPQRISLPGGRKLIMSEKEIRYEVYGKKYMILDSESKFYDIQYKIISKNDDIADFILPLLDEYKQIFDQKWIEFSPKKKTLYHFIYNGMDKKTPIFSTTVLNQPGSEQENFETFEHLHQEYSTILKTDLIKLNNLEYYRKRGLKRKKGYLFHGKPGTGKTSSVIAMALFSERHIISINFSILTRQEELEILMNLSNIDGHTITPSNCILLFDEIECGLQNYSRDSVSSPCSNTPSNTDTMIGMNEEGIFISTGTQPPPCETEHKLDIAKILSSMDGVGGGNGRVIVGTTNYLDKIDKAFYRELRMTPYEFKELRKEDCIAIIQKFFNITLTPEQQDLIVDRTMIPAKLIHLCMQHENLSIEEFLHIIN